MGKRGVSTSLSTSFSAGWERSSSVQLPVFPAPECLAGVCGALGRAFGSFSFCCRITYSGIYRLQHFGSVGRVLWILRGLVLNSGRYTNTSALRWNKAWCSSAPKVRLRTCENMPACLQLLIMTAKAKLAAWAWSLYCFLVRLFAKCFWRVTALKCGSGTIRCKCPNPVWTSQKCCAPVRTAFSFPIYHGLFPRIHPKFCLVKNLALFLWSSILLIACSLEDFCQCLPPACSLLDYASAAFAEQPRRGGISDPVALGSAARTAWHFSGLQLLLRPCSS